MRVFLDTDIILDTLVARDNPKFGENAATILSLGESGVLELRMSTLSIPTVAYILKNMTSSAKKAVIRELLDIIQPLPSLPEHIELMLASPMRDIEDALQVQSAKEGRCDIIVTRNTADFKLSEIPAIAPDDFLRRIFE